jgi:hypothetical protein
MWKQRDTSDKLSTSFIWMQILEGERQYHMKRARLSFLGKAYCLLSSREWIRGFHDLLTEKSVLSVCC